MIDLAIQKAILTRLKADSLLANSVSTRIHDYVPQKPTFPYISIGEDALTEFDTATHDGAEVIASIHTWSQKRGKKECKEIQARIRNALHKAPLTASGYVIDFCHWQQSQSFIDPDGITRHGVCTYNLYIREE